MPSSTSTPSNLFFQKKTKKILRSETYQYYKLPFCQPDELSRKKGGGLGEVVDGNRLVASPYSLRFGVDIPADRPARLCSTSLSADEADLLRGAVLEDYYFQFVADELPVYGFLGTVQEGEEQGRGAGAAGDKTVRLFTHLHLDATFSGDRVISVAARTDPAKSVVLPAGALAPLRADFTYSVSWTESDAVPFARRMDRYRRDTFLPQHLEVHWFAIANSCVTVLLLTAFLATILVRVLRADVSRYSGGKGGRPSSGGGVSGAIGGSSSSSSKGKNGAQPLEDPLFLDLDDGCDETGWKYLAHDVFRPPRHRTLFCALLGAGAQVAAMACGVFALAACGFFYPHARGAMQASLIGLYGATAGLAGYVSGSYHRQLGGARRGGDWVRCQLLTATVLAAPVFGAFAVSNSVAWAWGSTAALPAGTVALLLCGWTAATLPLTLLGGVVGKNSARPFDAPTRTARFAREVPALPWWRGAGPQALAAGFLPFSAIYIELYYVFLSVWGHKVRRRGRLSLSPFLSDALLLSFVSRSFSSHQSQNSPPPPPTKTKTKTKKTYTIYSILAIVFVILLLVTAFVTVALTYCEYILGFCFFFCALFLCRPAGPSFSKKTRSPVPPTHPPTRFFSLLLRFFLSSTQSSSPPRTTGGGGAPSPAAPRRASSSPGMRSTSSSRSLTWKGSCKVPFISGTLASPAGPSR